MDDKVSLLTNHSSVADHQPGSNHFCPDHKPMSQNAEDQVSVEENQEVSAYDLFILAITVLSLFAVLLIYLPFVANTETAIARDLDAVYCLIFLLDFFRQLYRTQDRKRYFLSGGWMDLAGSLPFLPIFRLFRIRRALQIIRMARRMGGRAVIHGYKQDLAAHAFWATTLAAILLLTVSALLIVPIEARSPNAQITHPSDALWWSLVTATTVGYGDLVPVTNSGRFLAAALMIISVVFIAILTGFITSKLYLSIRANTVQEDDVTAVKIKLVQIDQRLEKIEQLLEKQND